VTKQRFIYLFINLSRERRDERNRKKKMGMNSTGRGFSVQCVAVECRVTGVGLHGHGADGSARLPHLSCGGQRFKIRS
jgi:hypothetical protein